MLEILQNFEAAIGEAEQLRPIFLVGPGLACLVAGLFVWLGGLGVRKLLAAVVGAVSGAICGFFIIGRNAVFTIIFASVGAVIAIIFERTFITILAAILAAVFSFAVLAELHTESADNLNHSPQYRVSSRTDTRAAGQPGQLVKEFAADLFDRVKQTCLQMPAYNWAIIAVIVLISMVVGFLLWRLTSALCCSTLGTLLIFAGMILMLLYKGAEPISHISHKQSFYATVFLAMIAFGTIEQLLLCRPAKKQPVKEKDRRQQEKPQRRKHEWRST